MADSGNEPVAASTAPPVAEPNEKMAGATRWQKPLILGGVMLVPPWPPIS